MTVEIAEKYKKHFFEHAQETEGLENQLARIEERREKEKRKAERAEKGAERTRERLQEKEKRKAEREEKAIVRQREREEHKRKVQERKQEWLEKRTLREKEKQEREEKQTERLSNVIAIAFEEYQKKQSMNHFKIPHVAQKMGYNVFEDKYLLLQIHKLGYGNFEELRKLIHSDQRFKLNHFLLSRTAQDLKDRIDITSRTLAARHEKKRKLENAELPSPKKIRISP